MFVKIKKFFRYFRPLIEEIPGKISLGRVSFWVLFVFFLYHFEFYKEVPSNLVTLLLGLLTYGISKKFIDNKYSNGNGISDFLNDIKDKLSSSSSLDNKEKSGEELED